MNTSIHSGMDRQATWQEKFIQMLPEIERLLRLAFCRLTPEARDDCAENGIVHCLLSYARLFEQGRAETATPSSLAWFAALQIRRGRLPGCRMNSLEVLSRYAQLGRKFKVVSLHHSDPQDDTWVNDVIGNQRWSIADQVAIKLDFVAWLGSLCRRTRSIATDLARGFSTSEVAHKHRLSAGRVSQLRRELKNSWQQFQGEPSLATAS